MEATLESICTFNNWAVSYVVMITSVIMYLFPIARPFIEDNCSYINSSVSSRKKIECEYIGERASLYTSCHS